jgi:hypothetical protein
MDVLCGFDAGNIRGEEGEWTFEVEGERWVTSLVRCGQAAEFGTEYKNPLLLAMVPRPARMAFLGAERREGRLVVGVDVGRGTTECTAAAAGRTTATSAGAATGSTAGSTSTTAAALASSTGGSATGAGAGGSSELTVDLDVDLLLLGGLGGLGSGLLLQSPSAQKL